MKKVLIFLVFLLTVSCGKNYDKMTSAELEREIAKETEKFEKNSTKEISNYRNCTRQTEK